MVPTTSEYWKTLLVSLTLLAVISLASFQARAVARELTLHETVNAAAAPAISRNWSGYAATNGPYTAVTGTWDVPQITGGSGKLAADATWVGIGGVSSSDLIQSGTQDIVGPGGQVFTSAFFEILPAAAQPLPVVIRGGDSITVSLTEYAANQWRLTFQDSTDGQAYTATVSYPSSLSSAEWIEEAPSRGNKILPLDHFGVVQFSACSTIQKGSAINIAQSGAQAVALVSKSRQALATPSLLAANGASFTVTRA